MPALSRRSLITGLISFVAAPAIVRAGSLMPVKVMVPAWPQLVTYIDPEVVRVVFGSDAATYAKRIQTIAWATAGLGHRFDPIEAFGWR